MDVFMDVRAYIQACMSMLGRMSAPAHIDILVHVLARVRLL
jgi:hypothetical protein